MSSTTELSPDRKSHSFAFKMENIELSALDLSAKLKESRAFHRALSHSEAQKEAEAKAMQQGKAAHLLVEDENEAQVEAEIQEEEKQDRDSKEKDVADDDDENRNSVDAAKPQQGIRGGDPLKHQFQTKKSKANESGDIESLMISYGMMGAQLVAGATTAIADPEGPRTCRKCCAHVSHNVFFQSFFRVVILCNAIVMAYQASHDLHNPGQDWGAQPVGQGLSHMFTALFLIEVIINCLGSHTTVCHDPNLIFDIVIVCISVADNWIITPMSASMSEDVDLYFLSTLRIFRLLRVTKIFRLLRYLRPYRMMLTCMASSVSVILWMMIVLSFVSMTFSLVITHMLPGRDETLDPGRPSGRDPMERFSTFGDSLVTLLLIIGSGMHWGSELFEPFFNGSSNTQLASWVFWALILITIPLSNLICALFIERMFIASQEDDDEAGRDFLVKQDYEMRALRDILTKLNGGDDDLVPISDFQQLVEKEGNFGPTCHLVNVSSTTEAVQLFQQAENSTNKGMVAIDDFILLVMRYKGSTQQSLDMLSLDYQAQKALREVRSFANDCRGDSKKVQTLVENLNKAVAKLQKKINKLRTVCCNMLAKEEELMLKETPDQAETWISQEDDKKFQEMNRASRRDRAQELETNMHVRSRLDLIEHQLDTLTVAAAQARLSAGRAGQKPAVPLKIDVSYWQKLLEHDIKPWLRDELQNNLLIKDEQSGVDDEGSTTLLCGHAISPVRKESPWAMNVTSDRLFTSSTSKAPLANADPMIALSNIGSFLSVYNAHPAANGAAPPTGSTTRSHSTKDPSVISTL
eukprot:gnl/MRDRNA2_/MRDRNA2_120135_c0_seq1.p1 gnl/MRDRNA2_/MRDRNA2_120135_c0~~gnl/MRDRNA2_/MRDRNA2_120135_c0_seq1.p1  ORF type:complete len:807 (+),score=142.59 gnl/MRDRNA2_/MRDRNA2_120135_c0_seq1:118-2538(+)